MRPNRAMQLTRGTTIADRLTSSAHWTTRDGQLIASVRPPGWGVEIVTPQQLVVAEVSSIDLRSLAIKPQDWALAALAALHREGVVHADVKPSNIMLDPEGRVIVADFGIAHRIGRDEGSSQGTPRYMPPEQFTGRIAGPQTDLYALGCVAHELIKGIVWFRWWPVRGE